jgi:glutamine synthetase
MAHSIADLADAGVKYIRVSYPDLHGVSRGKDIPISAFSAEHGVGFCEAIMTVDLHHNVVAGFEHGFRDIAARADLSTLVRVPSDDEVAWCLSDLVRWPDGAPYAGDPRGAVKRAIAGLEAEGLIPVIAPEHEFYLCRRGDDGSYTRLDEINTPVYTVGEQADPSGVLRAIVEELEGLGLEPIAFAHEYGRSQYEVNLRHGDALDATDRAFRYKQAIKEVAAAFGLTATFMGKPWADDEGSGFHLHVSARDTSGRNLFDDPSHETGIADVARRFIAGVLAHAQGLSAVMAPTVNAYRRFEVESLAPTHANWGYGNRLCMVRVSDERGKASRVEVRSGDGSANVYLAVAATLFAGLDGIRRNLDPPAPLVGNPYEAPEEDWGPKLPGSLDESLAALEADEVLVEGLGSELVDTFLGIKRYELERWHHHLEQVTRWERDEYLHHL